MTRRTTLLALTFLVIGTLAWRDVQAQFSRTTRTTSVTSRSTVTRPTSSGYSRRVIPSYYSVQIQSLPGSAWTTVLSQVGYAAANDAYLERSMALMLGHVHAVRLLNNGQVVDVQVSQPPVLTPTEMADLAADVLVGFDPFNMPLEEYILTNVMDANRECRGGGLAGNKNTTLDQDGNPVHGSKNGSCQGKSLGQVIYDFLFGSDDGDQDSGESDPGDTRDPDDPINDDDDDGCWIPWITESEFQLMVTHSTINGELNEDLLAGALLNSLEAAGPSLAAQRLFGP